MRGGAFVSVGIALVRIANRLAAGRAWMRAGADGNASHTPCLSLTLSRVRRRNPRACSVQPAHVASAQRRALFGFSRGRFCFAALERDPALAEAVRHPVARMRIPLPLCAERRLSRGTVSGICASAPATLSAMPIIACIAFLGRCGMQHLAASPRCSRTGRGSVRDRRLRRRSRARLSASRRNVSSKPKYREDSVAFELVGISDALLPMGLCIDCGARPLAREHRQVLLAPPLATCRLDRHPGWSAELIERRQRGGFVDDGLDVAILFGQPFASSLVACKLPKIGAMIVAALAGVRKHGRLAMPADRAERYCPDAQPDHGAGAGMSVPRGPDVGCRA
ncbi:hypothetical protein [Burkholderia savannae]|uniref:hypothetical protein n=1 Tax=Burkholderia savannae TaxID=1637837 RepID=UPI0012E3C940|nr:hypothetical protein [Burkholderia savannae]